MMNKLESWLMDTSKHSIQRISVGNTENPQAGGLSDSFPSADRGDQGSKLTSYELINALDRIDLNINLMLQDQYLYGDQD